MTILQFMSDSPFLSFFLALIVGATISGVLVTLPNRILRHMTIRKHGYPPAHCDADGDFRADDKQRYNEKGKRR